MIQMAENRGLFGSNTSATTVKSKTTRASKKKVEKEKPVKPKKRLKDSEVRYFLIYIVLEIYFYIYFNILY